MDSGFVEILNNFKLGEAMLVLFGVGGIILAGYNFVTKYLSERDERIRQEITQTCNENNEETEMKELINKLSTDLESIHTSITTLDQKIDLNKNENDDRMKALQEYITTDNKRVKDENSQIKSNLQNFEVSLNKANKSIDKIGRQVAVLIDSDKEDIKGYIVSEHQKWFPLKVIDIYSMDTLEQRYAKYLIENGDTFVENLMNELRGLKKVKYSDYIDQIRSL